MPKNRDEAIQYVEEGLTYLVLSYKRSVASRQYVPSNDPDRDDDEVKEGKEFLETLRRLREEFENAVTGVL